MNLIDKIKNYNIILASKSPRRQMLLSGIGLKFEVIIPEIIENFDPTLSNEKIVEELSILKANAIDVRKYKDNYLLITADTIVSINNNILNKPKNYDDAFNMLRTLSGSKHEVITGVLLKSANKQKFFYDNTFVYFKELTDQEIKYYLDNYKPYDKAGSYGIQEWIGYIAIEKVEGSFYNVMGLPITQLYKELNLFID